MTEEQIKVIGELRDSGYAVVIFTPDELGDADPENLEDILVERGWAFL